MWKLSTVAISEIENRINLVYWNEVTLEYTERGCK